MTNQMTVADLRLILNQAESEQSKVLIQDGVTLFLPIDARTDEDGDVIIVLAEAS